MAERQKPQFYVYGFEDADGFVYIGKGSRSRLKTQERRFRKLAPLANGRILDWFLTEAAALEGEKRYIARFSPRLNITAGGNGGRVKRRPYARRQFWERSMLRFGSRKYAALLLLSCERSKRGSLDPSKIEAIRQVAYGGRA